ncbi:type II toxin-antitoxin system VapC family toxin [Brevundimonas sp. LM2]|uniref:type II toxin-antitoxin system VapC family toxin n=1 Tax=Brevundimonas sp. LM2 TaxID=1938605 RepID=UPI001559FBF4|nr:type II toxin-antitoxin system VapC family toxin [Brevundimonas sp. LM2]
MTLAFDTSTLVEVMRAREPNVRQRFVEAVGGPKRMVASIVVLHELLSGALAAHSPTREREKIARIMHAIEVAPLEESDAVSTASVLHQLRRLGRPIGDIDTLIAGQALARGWTVVTGNVRHFGRIEGLPLIDWSVGPEPLSTSEIARRVALGE